MTVVPLHIETVKRECDEGKKAVCQVYTLTLTSWRKHLFDPLQVPLTTAILCLVATQRDGASIGQALFVTLGLDATDPNKGCQGVYKEQFEAPFLAPTEACTFLDAGAERSGNILEYLKVERGEALACEDEEGVGGEDVFQALLDFDADKDLQCMYTLLARIPEGPELLHKKFEAHVTALVGGSDSAAAKDKDDTAKKDGDVDQKAYIDALLAVHEKNAVMVARSLKAKVSFAAVLHKACRKFVNQNVATGTSVDKSPELAKHADLLLRGSNKVAGAVDLEGALNRVMVLFKCLDDKDVFQTFYMTKLSKRLIHSISASEEAEASMISEDTNALQQMFMDISLSKDLTDSFNEWMTQNHGDMDIVFSIMLLPTFERFTRYYQTKHSGRKLTWLLNYLKNQLRTNYTNQKYILMMSAYQAAVLLQYDRNDTLSPQELQEAAKFSMEILGQVLALLVKVKVLVNDEKDQYDLNPGFKSKKIRVNLNLPIKVEVKAESTNVLKVVDEDHKFVIQVLIQEVISQNPDLAALCTKIPDIKKAIEMLLEKEYMERMDGSTDTFVYVA
ncbi:Cullin family-domain-containing protein [Mycena olivaceomarginata]|nr:Cullin family-domain-containing protein [Mycena olivaceomarginata]